MSSTVYSTLAADAPLMALVGSRLSLHPVPEKTDYPYITYQFVTSTTQDTLVFGECDLDSHRVQVNIYSRNAVEAAAIVEASKLAIAPIATKIEFYNYGSFNEVTRIYEAIVDFNYME